MFVAGDSHAGAYLRMLTKLAGEEKFEIRLYTKPGCAFLNFKVRTEDMSTDCAAFGRAVMTEIGESVRPGDFLFLPSLRVDRYRDQWGDDRLKQIQSMPIDDGAVQEARLFVETLGRRGVQIILEAPKPVFKSPPFRCSDWFNRANPVCGEGFVVSRKDAEERRAKVVAIERNVASSAPNVSIWDPMPVLCDEEKCNAYDGPTPLFFDGDHLSGKGNLVLYDSFLAHLRGG